MKSTIALVIHLKLFELSKIDSENHRGENCDASENWFFYQVLSTTFFITICPDVIRFKIGLKHTNTGQCW